MYYVRLYNLSVMNNFPFVILLIKILVLYALKYTNITLSKKVSNRYTYLYIYNIQYVYTFCTYIHIQTYTLLIYLSHIHIDLQESIC